VANSLERSEEVFPIRTVLAVTFGIAGYLLTAHLTFGNRPEQFALCGLMLVACVWSDRTRRFFRGMLPFLLFGISYDCLKLLQPLLPSVEVQVEWPYLFDKILFGVTTDDGRLSLGELFGQHHWAAVDFVCGLAYLLYLYVVIGLGLYLAVAKADDERNLLARFGWTFLFVNLAGFLTYFLFPVAPPWYVAVHGLGPVDPMARPDSAALVRWDQLTGIPCFATLYARSSDVFGSVPSLHCAYPMMAFLYARELRKRWLDVTLLSFWVLVVFSAVYLQHHYVLDTILGTAYALLGRGAELVIASGRSARLPAPALAPVSDAGA
jgi:hypothetical protein